MSSSLYACAAQKEKIVIIKVNEFKRDVLFVELVHILFFSIRKYRVRIRFFSKSFFSSSPVSPYPTLHRYTLYKYRVRTLRRASFPDVFGSRLFIYLQFCGLITAPISLKTFFSLSLRHNLFDCFVSILNSRTAVIDKINR